MVTHIIVGQNLVITNANTVLNNLESEFPEALISLSVVDPVTKKEIIARNSAKVMVPGSVQKIYTSGFGFEQLGSNYSIKTELYYSGAIDPKTQTLNGDILIKGNGDPTLGSKYIGEGKEKTLVHWVEGLRKAGIQNINGNILVDGSCFNGDPTPQSWIWMDLGNYYAPPISGLHFADDYYTVKLERTTQNGGKTRIIEYEPSFLELNITNQVITSTESSKDLSYIKGSYETSNRLITGTIPASNSLMTIKGSVPDPAIYTGLCFKDFLTKRNVKVSGAVILSNVTPSKLIYTSTSAALKDIIKVTNHKSLNLFAEQILLISAQGKQQRISHTEASNTLYKYLKSTLSSSKGLVIEDGSGLSVVNRTSTQQLSNYLLYTSTKSWFSDYKNSLPLVGVPEGIHYFCENNNAKGKVLAKSGTLTHAKSFAGYIIGKSGKLYPFALIVNDFETSTGIMANKLEPLMNILVELP